MADHLEQGIAAFLAGEPGTAFLHFRMAIQTDPNSAVAWYWLSRVVDSPQKQRDSLERALMIDPSYQPALQAMAALDGARTPPSEAPLSAPDTPGDTAGSPAASSIEPRVETAAEERPDEPAGPATEGSQPEILPHDAPPSVQEASIWPYPHAHGPAASWTPAAEPAPALEVEPSHEKRLEALAELEPLELRDEKQTRKGRRLWIWLLGALFLMLLLAVGYALLSYTHLPSYDALAPLLATISPQAFSRGHPVQTQSLTPGVPVEAPLTTPDVPVFKPEQWKLEPIRYERADLGGGQSQLLIDLALANYSRFLGAVTIEQHGVLTDGDGNEYDIDFGFEPRVLILPGTRLHSVDETRLLRFELTVPTASEDYQLRVAYKASLLNLDNGLSSSGEDVFAVDTQQVIPGPPSMFVNGSWEAFLSEAPSGVYAVEPGEAADFRTGQAALNRLSIPSANAADGAPAFIEASIWNPSSEGSLTLRTRFPTFLRVYRDSEWGTLVPANKSIQSMTAEPEQTATERVWSTGLEELPADRSETWCALGLFEIAIEADRQNRGLVTCFGVEPAASP